MVITTIKLRKETKDRLNHIRSYRRESYEDILNNMLDILSICRANPYKAQAKLIAIDKEKKRVHKPNNAK